MEMVQNSLSTEWTHIVGRHLPKEEQFNLLVQIIQSRHLHQDTPSIDLENILTLRTDLKKKDILFPEIISFYDTSYVQNKMNAFRFGLVFHRDFLISNGANPVFYITGDRLQNERDTDTNQERIINRMDWFSDHIRDCVKSVEQLKNLLGGYSPVSEELEEVTLLNQISEFLWNDIFAFIQPLDISNSTKDLANSYLAREWRMTGSLAFSMDDILRILIPKEYSKKLRERLPDYYGEIVFTE
ncbi:hypothetical protein [Oceanobacillus senegalensis]|uniref:hypothetical protein n=1 Tax=Oceanobacillus senegalensis TaxID=1936063 RepID=UPI0015C43895|nr:hypothetical protein [Oceanobacillus senegalensis]